MIASRENNKLQGWTAPDRSENGTRIFVAADISDWIRFKLQLKRWFFYFLRFQQNVIVNVPDTFSNIAGQFFSSVQTEGLRVFGASGNIITQTYINVRMKMSEG